MKPILISMGFIGFDVLTGVLKAAKQKSVNSTNLREGLYHKAAECLTIFGAYGIDYASAQMNLGVNLPVKNGVLVYICLMETVSIIENLCVVNPLLMKFFGPYLEKLKGGENNV